MSGITSHSLDLTILQGAIDSLRELEEYAICSARQSVLILDDRDFNSSCVLWELFDTRKITSVKHDATAFANRHNGQR